MLLIGSLLAVLGLALVARLLGLGGGGIDDAGASAEAALPGFVALEAFASQDGAAALVFGKGGEAALLKRHGAHLAARRLQRPLSAASIPDGVEIDSREHRFGRARLKLSPEQRDRLLTMM